MIEYTKLSDALTELERRKHLRPQIEAYLAKRGVGLPWDKGLGDGKPLAVLFRQVATPNYEIIRFLSIASGFGMQPLVLEYLGDKLSMENAYKKSLVCAPVVKKISSKGHVQFEKKWLCDPNLIRPQSILSELRTKDGSSVVNFHHKLFEKSPVSKESAVVDGTKWFQKTEGGAVGYYGNFLSLFVAHAILFENFPETGVEENFTKKIIAPALREVLGVFEENPLIVPINPTETEDASFWVCYPSEVFNGL